MKRHALNKLEERFIDLSNNQDFEFQEADWADLRSRLDKDESKNRYFYFFLLAGLVVLMIALVPWSFGSQVSDTIDTELSIVESPKDGIASEQLVASESAKSQFSQEIESPLIEGGTGISKSNTDDISKTVQSQVPQSGTSNNGVIKLQNDKATENTSSESALQQPALLVHKSGDNGVGYQSASVSLGSAVVADAPGLLSADTTNSRTSESGISSDAVAVSDLLDNQSFEEVVHAPASIKNLPNDILPLDTYGRYDIDKLHVDASSRSKFNRPKFFINLNAGVEIASTPLGERSDGDYNFGAKLGYVASSKLIVTTGVNYIKESYTAEGDDYTAPTGFWSATNGEAPESILAVCDMVEFSLGASYHFTDVQSRGLAAHVNLNSNFMVREEYDYLFTESDNDWTGIFEGESQSVLSNVELSTTYKFISASDYIIDAGPYLKIPTSGIGHGDVRLSSFGFRVGVSFLK